MVSSKIYKGFQITIPSSIRKELDISLDDRVEWSIEGGNIKLNIKKQESLDLLTNIVESHYPTDAVEIKKKAGRGEL